MKTARSHRSQCAFTLIELLVVISIIAILASLTFSGVNTALLSAKRAQAKNDMAQIVTALQQYYAEYGRYPFGIANADQTYGNGSPNDYMISVLRNVTSTDVKQADLDTYNPRQIQFLQPKLVSAPKGGIYSPPAGGGDGCWYDPWGKQYIIFIDGNYDGSITVSGIFGTSIPNPTIGVGAASIGYSLVKNPNATLPRNFNSITDLLSWQ